MALQESREEITAHVKERADIVQIIGETVELKKSGARYLGLCPFHGEKTPSFSVHSGQQFFHCFGCGESGDVFSFMMKYHNLDFPSALKELAGRYNITLPEKPRTKEQEKRARTRELMFAVNKKAAGIYQKCLHGSVIAEPARKYLEDRGISQEVQERFGLGYAPSVDSAGWEFLARQLNDRERAAGEELGLLVKKERGGCYDRFRDRVLFPIFEISGQICGFGGRIIGEGQPKYMNSPESLVFNKSKSLLGLYQQKEAVRRQKQVIIVEGNFDLISLVNRGCEHVVAPLGTALTREQLRLLKRFADEVVLLFDGDAAGVKAAIRAVPHFLAEQISGRVALLPAEHDPDTYMREKGPDALLALLEKAENLPEFVFARLVERYGLTLDGKSKIVEELQPLVKSAASPLQRSVIISHFADQLGLATVQLDDMLKRSIPLPVEPIPAPMPQAPLDNVRPLSPAQKHLAGFMVLNPTYLTTLEEGGIRSCLAGSIGEVLFLQLKSMLKKEETVEPEDLLTVLPEGAERSFVADLLLGATATQGTAVAPGNPEDEAAELLEWMHIRRLQQSSDQVLRQINDAQLTGDFEKLQGLMQEKQKIDRELQGVNE